MILVIIVIACLFAIAAEFTYIDEKHDKHCTIVNGERVIHADSQLEKFVYIIGYKYHDFIMAYMTKDMKHAMKREMENQRSNHTSKSDEDVFDEDGHIHVKSEYVDYSDPKNNPFEL